jgi:hypothetical protein
VKEVLPDSKVLLNPDNQEVGPQRVVILRTLPRARDIIEFCASSRRNQRSTSLEKVCDKILKESSLSSSHRKRVREEVIVALKRFEELGLGEYLVGRRGLETRFEWSYDPVELLEELSGNESVRSRPTSQLEESQEALIIDHSYNLRSDFRVRLRLPANLSEKEAQRLAEFIKTLPLS